MTLRNSIARIVVWDPRDWFEYGPDNALFFPGFAFHGFAGNTSVIPFPHSFELRASSLIFHLSFLPPPPSVLFAIFLKNRLTSQYPSSLLYLQPREKPLEWRTATKGFSGERLYEKVL